MKIRVKIKKKNYLWNIKITTSRIYHCCNWDWGGIKNPTKYLFGHIKEFLCFSKFSYGAGSLYIEKAEDDKSLN